MSDYFSYLFLNKTVLVPNFFTIYVVRRQSEFSLRSVSVVYKERSSLLASRVSCLSLWARQNFPAPLK